MEDTHINQQSTYGPLPPKTDTSLPHQTIWSLQGSLGLLTVGWVGMLFCHDPPCSLGGDRKCGLPEPSDEAEGSQLSLSAHSSPDPGLGQSFPLPRPPFAPLLNEEVEPGQ